MIYQIIYNLTLFLAILTLAPFWLTWLCLAPKIRAGFWEKLGQFSPDFRMKIAALPLSNRVWIHAVSVGELNAAKPLIQSLKSKNIPVIISTTTLTGNTLAQKTYPDLPVVYFPFDLPGCVHHALQTIKPKVVIMMETEIWPNFLWQASKLSIQVVMANGRISDRSLHRYRKLKSFFSQVVSLYTTLFMQSEEDARRVKALGAPENKVVVTGNIKFDIPALDDATLAKAQTLKTLFNICDNTQTLVFASTHQGEEEGFATLYHNLLSEFPQLRCILAVRHPERVPSVVSKLQEMDFPCVRRSELKTQDSNLPSEHIIILDTIGELMALYTISTVACIGGSFIPWGGHNPLEPINAKIPVIFGVHMHNFKDIAKLVLQSKSGFQAKTIEDAQAHIHMLLTQPALYEATVKQGQNLLSQNRGTTQTILNDLTLLLSAASPK